jgi:large subunit ribosomal protein L4
MKETVYTIEGKESGSIDLPESIFGLPWNGDLVHQVVISMQKSVRTNLAHTKDRGDVRGGGKKPWAQKGTGRSRHGSSRSPIWKGGGVTHGPTNEKNYDKKVNKKMKTKAFNVLLSQKYRDGEIIFIDSFDGFDKPATAKAKATIDAITKATGKKSLGYKKNNNAFVAISEQNLNARKSFKNFGNIKFDEVRNTNPVDIAKYKYLIIENPAKSLEVLSARIK